MMTTSNINPPTFDDVPKRAYVRHRGRRGVVMDKGDEIMQSEGRHLRIVYINDPKRNHANLHENVVNKYLKHQNKLWVDFNRRLYTKE